VQNSSFTTNEAFYGGAIYVSDAGDKSNVSISDSNFTQNLADTGGALYIRSVANTTLRGNIFRGNQALKSII